MNKFQTSLLGILLATTGLTGCKLEILAKVDQASITQEVDSDGEDNERVAGLTNFKLVLNVPYQPVAVATSVAENEDRLCDLAPGADESALESAVVSGCLQPPPEEMISISVSALDDAGKEYEVLAMVLNGSSGCIGPSAGAETTSCSIQKFTRFVLSRKDGDAYLVADMALRQRRMFDECNSEIENCWSYGMPKAVILAKSSQGDEENLIQQAFLPVFKSAERSLLLDSLTDVVIKKLAAEPELYDHDE